MRDQKIEKIFTGKEYSLYQESDMSLIQMLIISKIKFKVAQVRPNFNFDILILQATEIAHTIDEISHIDYLQQWNEKGLDNNEYHICCWISEMLRKKLYSYFGVCLAHVEVAIVNHFK